MRGGGEKREAYAEGWIRQKGRSQSTKKRGRAGRVKEGLSGLTRKKKKGETRPEKRKSSEKTKILKRRRAENKQGERKVEIKNIREGKTHLARSSTKRKTGGKSRSGKKH